jgi:hypothetical protein
MPISRFVHLTVAKDGVISLWDTRAQAIRTTGETYLMLEWTDHQVTRLREAQATATQNNQAPA